MDAHDIFKKLSRGAKFKKAKTETPKDVSKASIKPKEEFDESCMDTSTENQKLSNEKHAITLLGEITSDSIKEKHKKALKKSKIDPEKLQQMQKQEETNRFCNEHNINVVGRHIPDPVRSFDDIKVANDLKENIKLYGYKEPTPIQMQAIPLMLEYRQILACAPTGSGKTAAFLVPIIHSLVSPCKKGFRALIICPTRELAQQTQRVCLKLSEGRGFKTFTIDKVNRIKLGDILVTTPQRLCYLLDQDERQIDLSNVQWVVIDEADKLFEEGVRSFKDQLKQILSACTFKQRRIAMFSATYTPLVAKWCVKNMKGLVRVTIGQRNTAADLLDQELIFVGNEAGKLIAFRDLVRKGLKPPVLVFVQSKERAQQLFSELIYDGINVDAIHADRTQLQRENTVRCFREGKIWVLICTELMARGIDFKGVNLVINYDFPPSVISYVHRIGRAGRAGLKGKAITFFTTEDTVNLRSIAHILKQSGCEVPNYMLYMKKQSKKQKKSLKSSAPLRDDILTVPFDDRIRIDKQLGKKRLIETFKRKKMINAKKKKQSSVGKLKKSDKKEKSNMKKQKTKKKSDH